MVKQHAKSKKLKKTSMYIGVVLILIIAGLLIWHKYEKKSQPISTHESKSITAATSTPTTHSSSNNNLTPGGATDQQGQTTSTLPPSSQWASSSSGNITLQQPSANSTVKSGDELSGLANVSAVQFILTDSAVGLIAQGNLNVVNGKFSGVLQFTPHASTGTLEVYYSNPTNGAEEDIINIPVDYNF